MIQCRSGAPISRAWPMQWIRRAGRDGRELYAGSGKLATGLDYRMLRVRRMSFTAAPVAAARAEARRGDANQSGFLRFFFAAIRRTGSRGAAGSATWGADAPSPVAGLLVGVAPRWRWRRPSSFASARSRRRHGPGVHGHASISPNTPSRWGLKPAARRNPPIVNTLGEQSFRAAWSHAARV